jgi:proton-translocating NADH-quinone oxidoreductase chain M
LYFIISNFFEGFFEKNFFLFEIINNLNFYLSAFDRLLYGFDFNLISLSFIFVTFILIFLSLFYNYLINIPFNFLFCYLLVLLQFLLCNFFLSSSLLDFYIFFECILIPMFLIIGLWGSRHRKIHAAYQFFFYTLIGSIFLLILLILFEEIFDIYTFYEVFFYFNFIFEDNVPFYLSFLIFLFFFISLAIKVPLFPFHIWLPEAHVEAPTAGSVILAGILLKLGGFGFLKIFFFCIPFITSYFMFILILFSLLGIIYSSVITLAQIDLKKIIAYSSIIHMSYAILGLASFNNEGFLGSYYLMFSHSFVSSGLFFIIGFLYDRYHTRNIYYYGGLALTMPLLSISFFLLTLANVGFPGTSSFIGEFLICISFFENSFFILLFSSIPLFFNAIFSFWLYNRVIFGYTRITKENISLKRVLINFYDMNFSEFLILLPLLVFIIVFGLYHLSINYLLLNITSLIFEQNILNFSDDSFFFFLTK